MPKYRIVEERGVKTDNTRFYIQVYKKFLFGGYKWVDKYKFNSGAPGSKTLITFDTLQEAVDWLNYNTEEVTLKYHTF